MGRINVLDKHLAELIAAGEVVERPASVVKELLENCIDAKATSITVEIKDGGITFIRVSDNGIGIMREDVPKAFLRNATSKVGTEDDLEGIATLGFRGEALASVAAVAKVELITKTYDEDLGTKYEICGGEEVYYDDCGAADGTTIIVKDLFYNTPARLKFLKKNVSEANAVAAVVDHLALSYPDVSFSFIRDGKNTLKTLGDGKLSSCIYSVYGKSFLETLIPIDYELNGIKVSGYISKPTSSRGSRSMQHFFINSRYVRTRTAMAAMEEAYKGSIMAGKFPACIMYISLPFDAVDVNVHPAKTEVRFINERPIFEAVYHGVKFALNKEARGVVMKLTENNKLKPKVQPYTCDVRQKLDTQVKDCDIKSKSQPVKTSELQTLVENPQSHNIQTANITFSAKESKVDDSVDIFKSSNPVKEKDSAIITKEDREFARADAFVTPKSAESTFSEQIIAKDDGIDISVPHKTFTYEVSDKVHTSVPEQEHKSFTKSADNTVSKDMGVKVTMFNSSHSAGDDSPSDEIRDVGYDAYHAKYFLPKTDQSDITQDEEIKGMDKHQEIAPNEAATFSERIFEKANRKLIGEVFDTYLIVQVGADKLVFIDKHAAHERMLYEKLKDGHAKDFAQVLLSPVSVVLAKGEYDAVLSNLDLLQEAGFDVEAFGSSAVIVRSAPMYLECSEISGAILEIAGYFISHSKNVSTHKRDWLLHNTACRAAVKGGTAMKWQEMVDFVDRLGENPDIKYCPHGRPVSLVLSKKEIEKKFGRIQ